jgi:hypothetical protein
MAQKNIAIIELDEIGAKAILKETKFSRLKPAACAKRGNKIDFERKLFQIKGIPKSKKALGSRNTEGRTSTGNIRV